MKKYVRLVIVMALAVSTIACFGCSKSKPRPNAGVGFTPELITLKEVADSDLKELADEKLVFVDAAGGEWLAPKGTLTDGISVPRLALWLTDGRFAKESLKAAVVHDAHCQSENETRTPDQYRTKPWKTVHRMFYEACIAGGTFPLKAKILFAGVWLGGPRWNDPDRMLDQISDDALKTEFDACEVWIDANDPTIEEIETWMDEREHGLLGDDQ